jgi:hypothetical protein
MTPILEIARKGRMDVLKKAAVRDLMFQFVPQ